MEGLSKRGLTVSFLQRRKECIFLTCKIPTSCQHEIAMGQHHKLYISNACSGRTQDSYQLSFHSSILVLPLISFTFVVLILVFTLVNFTEDPVRISPRPNSSSMPRVVLHFNIWLYLDATFTKDLTTIQKLRNNNQLA